MKVLVLSTVRLMKNGIATVIYQYYEYLKDKVDFDFVCLDEIDPSTKKELLHNHRKVYVLHNRKKKPLKYLKTIINICKTNKYDIIHVHGNSSSMLLELLAARFSNIKIRIVHAHAISSNHPKINRMLSPIISTLSAYRLACSDKAGEFLYRNHPFCVLPNAFNTSDYIFNEDIRNIYRHNLKIKDSEFVIGYIAVFSEVKNHRFLIDAFDSYCNYNPNARLILVGDGNQYQEMRRYANSKSFGPLITFLGVRNDVNRLLNALDYVLFPSKSEGLGIALLEAEANGLPIIANKDGISEKVRINTNFLFLAADDPHKWAIELFERPCCRVVDGAERVKQSGFDISEQGEKLLRIYSSLLHNHR